MIQYICLLRFRIFMLQVLCVTFEMLYLESKWSLLKQGACFQGINDKPAEVPINQNGIIVEVKLVHQSGSVKCAPSAIGSNFGCDQTLFTTLICNKNKNIIFPPPSKITTYQLLDYKYPGYFPTDQEVIFTNYYDPSYFTVGDFIYIWNNEDLFDISDWDNSGQVCVDVYASFTDSMEDFAEHVLTQNNLIAIWPLLNKTFSITFEVKPLSYKLNSYASVFHLTIGHDMQDYGDRSPGVWFYGSSDGSGTLYIYSAINGYFNYGVITKPILLNEWSKVIISQFLINDIYTYTVFLNGENVHSIINSQPKTFSNVKVYAANPWYDAQVGSIKNIRITNENEVMCGSCFLLVTAHSSIYNSEQIYTHVNLTTDCLCYLQNVSIYLHPESFVIFKGFLWDGLSVNESCVKKHGEYLLVQVDTLSKYYYASFSAIFVYDKQVPVGKKNMSVECYSTWSYSNGKTVVYSVNRQIIELPIERLFPKVVKMELTCKEKHLNGTSFETEAYHFLCSTMQKRQPSPCYQRELSTGVIIFLPIQVLCVFGFDSRTSVIYGRTHRNNVIEMALNNRKPVIITNERCFKINACQLNISE